MIKPDGVQRGLVSKIIARFEEKGFKLVGAVPRRCFACSVVSRARARGGSCRILRHAIRGRSRSS
jgi:nucleoside diphosphate kinase